MEKVHIATIVKPQGLKGELKCKLENDNFTLIENVSEVFLNDKDVPTRVLNKRVNGGFLYLALSTINSREKADLMRGFKIYADQKFITVPKDEYLISELINSRVISENGEQIGTLLDIQNFGAGDILIIEQYKREYMVPFVKEVVLKVNASAGIIVVNKAKYDQSKICD